MHCELLIGDKYSKQATVHHWSTLPVVEHHPSEAFMLREQLSGNMCFLPAVSFCLGQRRPGVF